ncbi:MAG: InlB B-repeat-containing protein [Bacteroidales bacterium]|nr:InlB B-repeat-containing protein [Bacteroidales bacterium]
MGTEDATVTANFWPTITYSAINGSIAGQDAGSNTVNSGDAIEPSSTITLFATPSSGYAFSGWSVSETGASLGSTSNNPTTLTMGSAPTTVTATFVASSGYITVSPTLATPSCAAQNIAFSIDTDQTLASNPTVFYTSSAGTTSTTKPDWIGDILYDDDELVVAVKQNKTSSPRTAYFKVESGSVKSDVITITQSAFTLPAPSFDPESGTVIINEYVVLLESDTTGATIYYTIGENPATPTTSSSVYDPDEGITVDETTTIKAIAVKYNISSSVATANYTVVNPLTTMDQIFSAATTAGSTATNKYVTLGNWVVSGVSTDEKTAYVTDGSGKGFITYYGSKPGFAVGNILSNTVQASLKLYNGAAEFTNLTTSTTNITVNTGGTITPITNKTIADLSGVCTGGVYTLGGLKYNSTSKYLSDGTDSIQPYNQLYSGMSFTNGETYNVTGVYLQYGNKKEILPRSSSDIVVAPGVTTSVSSISDFTYNYGGGPDSKSFTVSGANLTANISVATNSANFEISSDNSNWQTSDITISKGSGTVSATTIYVRLKSGLSSNTYNGKITVSSDGADDKEIALTGTVKQTITISGSIENGSVNATISAATVNAAVAGETVTITATADDGYRFSTFSVKDADEGNVSLSPDAKTNPATFTMPSKNVTVSATFVEAYSVTYNANGGTGEMSDPNSPYISGSTVTVLDNEFTREGYEFSSWNTKSDGSGDYYDPDDEFLINADTTLYAQWGAQSFNVALSSVANVDLLASYGDEEEIEAGANADVAYGTEITLSATNVTAGKVFIWSVKKQSDNSDVTDDVLNGDVLTVPAYAITIGGQVAELFFQYSGELTEGDYIIANGSYAMLNTLNSKRFNRQSISPSNNRIIVADASAYLWHIASSGDYWTIYNAAKKQYAVSTGTASQIELGDNSDDKCLFSVSGTATYTIVSKYNTAQSVNAILRDGGTYWACYGSGTANTLYKKAVGSKHSVAIATGITNGSVEATPSSAYEGQTVSLTATPSSGYMLDSWDVYKTDDTSTKITINNNTFTMPGYDVTVSATFRVQHTYTLVDGSTVTLEAGKHYIIASGTNGKIPAMGKQNGAVRDTVHIKVTSNTFTEVNGLYEVVLSGDNTNKWTMYDVKNSKYICATSSSSNDVGMQTSNDANGKWALSMDGSAVTLTAQGTNTKNMFRYNTGSPRFTCYSSGQSAVYLYVRDGDTDLEFHSPTTLESLTIANNETYTVESGQVLEVSEALTNNGTAANLVIEDGGQLITKSSGVNATVKKNIEQAADWGTLYTYTSDQWYFVASPVNGAAFPTGSINDQDIYKLDWANNKWLNLQHSDNSSLLEAGFQRGTGYLYASKEGNTISVAGVIQPLSNDNTATVTLANDGWNLIGNPLTCKVTVDCAFSELVNASAVTNKEANSVINPCQGIAVYGNAGTEVTFTKAATQDAVAPSNNNSLQMTLAKTITSRGDVSTKVVDNAVVSFKESKCMPKFNMIGSNTKLFIPQDDEEYSIVFSDRQGDVPLYFKANETGTYTISFAGDEMSLNGIYLIDILAEEEIDLSVNPSYTFIGSPADRMARFKIVFRNANGDGTSDIFAYQSGNDIIVSGEGELQIFDVMGRMVSRQRVNGVETVNVKSQGVYIFRLNDKTQKIVVR